MSQLAIRCQGIRKTYAGKPPVEALRGVDLEVEQGECFGVLGPNGAGKTTAIEIMEGLLPATDGEVEILGRRWDADADEIRHNIGITLQETNFSDKLTVREILALFRSFYRDGVSPWDVMARVSLEEKAHAWVKTLSGGQKQRLAVASALVGDPQLLFLDEPTTGLDPNSRRQIWEIVEELRQMGRTILLTTHYMEEAERMCDRVAIIDRGRIIASGTPHELVSRIGGGHMIEITLADDGQRLHVEAERTWSELEGVTSVSLDGNRVRLAVTETHTVIPALLDRIRQQNLELSSMVTRHASLEDVFVEITGRHLHDGEQAE